MKIDNLKPGQYLPTGQELPQANPDSAKGVRSAKTPTGDSIELSNNTILAREIALPEVPVEETQLLTPERVAEIRARMGRGFYNSSTVSREAADIIIASFKGNPK